MTITRLSRLHASVAGLLLMLPLADSGFAPDAAAAEPAVQQSAASQQTPVAKKAVANDASLASKQKIPVAAIASNISVSAANESTSTSSTPPEERPFSSRAVPVRDYPRVASSGGCAPTYRNGTRGTCIAEKPCRGYGIRNDEKQVLCMCFLKKGGCDQETRCDLRAHACVADTKEPNYSE